MDINTLTDYISAVIAKSNREEARREIELDAAIEHVRADNVQLAEWLEELKILR